MRETAVKNNGLALQFIWRASEYIKLLAIHQNPNALAFIEFPTKEMRFLSYHKLGYNVEYLPKSMDVESTISQMI